MMVDGHFLWDVPSFFCGTKSTVPPYFCGFHTQRPRFTVGILGIAVAGAHHGDLLIGIAAHGTHGCRTSRGRRRRGVTSGTFCGAKNSSETPEVPDFRPKSIKNHQKPLEDGLTWCHLIQTPSKAERHNH